MGSKRRRMAGRYARRAKISGEEAVTISFGFSSLAIAILAGVLEELPYVGLLVALLFFHFHRTVLVTDRHVYVYRDLPFHRPGARLGRGGSARTLPYDFAGVFRHARCPDSRWT